jgi:hypothetical protein
MLIAFANLLASYIGLLISMVDKLKVRASHLTMIFPTSPHLRNDTGLGLHLKELAQQTPTRFDLHQPDRLLSSLSEYEHLHRIFRLCHVHIYRNIKNCSVSESVKNKMRSLVCMDHRDFEGTLCDIEREGGKAGSGE